MKNKIYFISSGEMKKLKDNFNEKKDVFIVEINGNTIQNQKDFLNIMTEKFEFPYSVNGFDGYFDWLRDLEWLEKEEYILIINDFKNFIKNDISLKEMIIKDFENVVLPWWEKEVEDCVVEGRAKLFTVYLVD